MKLTRLKIHGFKSFVDAADIPIEPGVTGIVGPNGCGKSNLVDALRFVMGESSYKAMRGGGMDDVIFSGAGARPSRNMAEVTLMAERDAPGGPEQLEITRRIEREVGSIYRVNGRDMRARDVQLLFADAATGAHSSALVRQGQVAELIAAKPVQRRGVLEDAAGISGLHSRRGEAEGKLKAAEANLERLDDVTSEIAGQLESVRRQARQAVRYRKLSAEIRTTEAVLFSASWEAAMARCAEAQSSLAAAVTAYAAAVAEQTIAARDEAVAAAALPGLRDAAAAALAALQRARFAAGELDREEAALTALRRELAARRAQAVADLDHQTEIGGDAAAAAGRIETQTAELRAQGDHAAERIAAARAVANAAAADTAAIEAEFAAAAAALATAAGERDARQRMLRESQARLRRLADERAVVLTERDSLQRDGHRDDAAKAAADLAAAMAELVTREAGAQAAESALAAAHQTERRARAPYEAAERALGALQAEARTLADLLDLDKAKRFPPLIDSLHAAPGYEAALVAALGDDLDAALDAAAPVHWGACDPGEADPALPAGATPLADHVDGPANLARRLRQVGVVAADTAAALAAGLAVGQRLVTPEGALWRWDGLRAQAGAETASARRLAQRGRVAAVLAELKTAKAAAEAASRLFETAREVRADAERLDAESRSALRAARSSADRSRSAHSEAERRQSRVGEKLSAFAGALARIEADTDSTRADVRAAGDALAALPETVEHEGRRETLRAGLDEARGKAAELRLDAERAAHDEAARQRSAADLATERERWATRIARAGERVAELTGRLSAIDREIAALADDPHDMAQRRRTLLNAIGAAESTSAAAADRLSEAESAHRQAAQTARAALEAHGRAREARARDEERAVAAGVRRDELAAQIAEHFGCAAGELGRVAGLDSGARAPSVAATEARLARLRSERDKLGGVNLRAEEEAAEIETRLDTMRAELADLQGAIKRLRQGIQNLNREGRERLLAAFEEVNGHFRSLFQHLFGGGTAELSLTGSDPLEAGLEIVARPPGKRPQTMTLLSGGEQALTALSLIFAVFLTNPSPVCVLDEVDAPLDDANVERFCALLEDMRRRTDTRFLVITHNPITMARMDRLFGVTMGERGVSQIVSVDLQAGDGFRAAS